MYAAWIDEVVCVCVCICVDVFLIGTEYILLVYRGIKVGVLEDFDVNCFQIVCSHVDSKIVGVCRGIPEGFRQIEGCSKVAGLDLDAEDTEVWLVQLPYEVM